MAKGPDPRVDPAPRADVPRLLQEGAEHWNAARFWHAHEAWESAWHTLRKAGEDEAAAYVKGLILVAAGLENATRGKEAGFKRQFAEGLFALRTRRPVGLPLPSAPAFEDALVVLYADACRRLDWHAWRASGWAAPRIDVGRS